MSHSDQNLEDKQTIFRNFLTGLLLAPSAMEALQGLIQTKPELLLGEHYWRAISKNGIDFGLSAESDRYSNVVAFSRISNETEILCAFNLDSQEQAMVYVMLDDRLHASGARMHCLFASGASPGELNVEDRNGKAIRLTVPPGGLVIYE